MEEDSKMETGKQLRDKTLYTNRYRLNVRVPAKFIC